MGFDVTCSVLVTSVKAEPEVSLNIVTQLIQFKKKNPTRCNNASKFYYSIFTSI
jgi:hypothetical protein